eukprot:TRINITY_DN773189_c0_g1_i1.p1 TRINITY_DN773189_c0_g1~~TRINITY_DN773189_c0_g1_i1.p1  ORF type:complete len:297 (+),score=75.93 TRINITY_DN773189_c0_g1_i1:49-939(+)
MKIITCCLLLLLSVAFAQIIEMDYTPKHGKNQPFNNEKIKNNLPASIDWRWINGRRFTLPVRNQHAPSTDPNAYCGSCWAVSTTNMIASRWLIENKDKNVPEVQLSVQEVISGCANSGSCNGGNSGSLLEYAEKYGLVDETCNPYLAIDRPSCSQREYYRRCYTCNRGVGCQAMNTYYEYFVTEHGEVRGEREMMAEIATRGPIVVSIHDPAELKAFNSTGVFKWDGSAKWATHNVLAVGYGEEQGQKYWLIQNSWGTTWNAPDEGYVKIIRGIDNLGIESNMSTWATGVRKQLHN